MALVHSAGLTALAERVLAPLGCMLMFHRVSRTEDWATRPNRDFYIDAKFLGGLIGYLKNSGWDVVTMDEALRRIHAGPDVGRFVNFSIDDTYRDTAELAAPLFRAHGVPVTLFVTTGIPDRTMPLWVAGLETIIQERDEVVLPEGRRASAHDVEAKRTLFERLCREWEQGDPERPYHGLCHANGYAPEELHDRHAMSWSMLETLSADPMVEIGGHTVVHPRLSALSDADAEREIASCRARLQERLSVPVRHFAFPYGRSGDCGEREFAFARRAGFATAATTRKGVIRRDPGRGVHALPRNTLNGAHRNLELVEAHLSGLTGLAARLLRAG